MSNNFKKIAVMAVISASVVSMSTGCSDLSESRRIKPEKFWY